MPRSARVRSALIPFLLAAALAGCGDDRAIRPDAGVGDPDAAVPDAPALGLDYCARLSEEICAGTASCACVEPAGGFDCEQRVRRQCERSISPLIGLTALGYLTFDADQLDACAAQVRAVADACAAPTPRNQPAACARTFVDRAQDGEVCSPWPGVACAGGAGACVRDEPPSTTLRCALLPAADQPCLRGACSPGLTCDSDTCRALSGADDVCAVDATCTPALVCGAAATCAAPGAVDAACDEDADCDAGLRCDAGQCGDAAALGAACSVSFECGADRLCAPTGAPRTCAAKATAGEPCPAYDDCAAGLACDYAVATPVCQSLPLVDQPCLSGQCAPGVACGFQTQTCVALPGDGEPCLADASAACAADCSWRGARAPRPAPSASRASAALVAPARSASRDDLDVPGPGGIGAPCDADDARCSAGLHCAAGACAAGLAAGAACERDPQCGANAACAFGPSGGACVVLPTSAGATCDGACGSGLRCGPAPGQCVGGACALRQ